eukprot:gene7837-1037_t
MDKFIPDRLKPGNPVDNREAPFHVIVSLEMTCRNGIPAPVRYKSEGTRFKGYDTTLKLTQDSEYSLNISLEPPHKIENVSARTECGMLVLGSMPFRSVSQQEDISEYTIPWPSVWPANNDKNRYKASVDLMLENFGLVSLPLLIKMYEHGDYGLKTGNLMKKVQFIYKVSSDQPALHGKPAFFSQPG